MAFPQTTFKTIARAAAIGIALGASSLASLPAAAQSFDSNFTLRIESAQHERWRDDFRLRCLTEREVVRGLSAYGYRHVAITGAHGRDRLGLRAVKGNWVYTMRIDLCTGQVDRLRRAGRVNGAYDGPDRGLHHDDGYRGGGFRFEFNFGH